MEGSIGCTSIFPSMLLTGQVSRSGMHHSQQEHPKASRSFALAGWAGNKRAQAPKGRSFPRFRNASTVSQKVGRFHLLRTYSELQTDGKKQSPCIQTRGAESNKENSTQGLKQQLISLNHIIMHTPNPGGKKPYYIVLSFYAGQIET